MALDCYPHYAENIKEVENELKFLVSIICESTHYCAVNVCFSFVFVGERSNYFLSLSGQKGRFGGNLENTTRQ